MILHGSNFKCDLPNPPLPNEEKKNIKISFELTVSSFVIAQGGTLNPKKHVIHLFS